MSAQRRRRQLADLAIYALLVLACCGVVLPILWALSTSLKLPPEIHAGGHWWPQAPTVRNYLTGALAPRFLRYIANTLLVFALTLLLSVALAVHAAYAVVRRKFRGKNVLLFAIWATIMIPGVSIVVPLYTLSVDVGLYDTYPVLVLVYAAWLIPTLIWLLRGFVAAVPPSLEEAALVDGCTPLRAFYLVVLPLLQPGLGAAAVLVFVTIWNDFLIGFALTLSDEHRILQVGLQAFVTEGGIDWGPMMAATIGSMVPACILFALLQRSFIQGLTGGAVKG
ncbi:MAG: carbohydrate ABC transporter permease [Nevskiales bacterium]